MSDEHEPTTRSFRPGEWFGVFGRHASVLLPPTEKRRVAALWEMVDDGAGFDETLDALIATGLRDLPSFVLVSEDSGETRVVLRGAVRASFTTADETVDLDGSVATTWVERSLPGVTRMSVELAEEVGGDDLRLVGGLVRLARVDQPPRSAEPEPSPQAALLPDTEPEPGPVPVPAPESAPQPAPEPAPRAAVDWYAGLDEPTEAVPLMGGGPWAEPDAEHRAEPLSEPEAEPEAGPEAAPEAEPVEDVQPVAEPAVDDEEPYYDEPPIWVPRSEIPPFGPPVLPPPPPEPPVMGSHAADSSDAAGGSNSRLVFSSGETVEVDGVLLVGRAPEARRVTTGEEPRLVTVPSPHQEISSTHLEIRPGSGADSGSPVVTDLGSTNGTVLVEPGRPPEDLQPGIAVRLAEGAVLDLGDGVTIRVDHA